MKDKTEFKTLLEEISQTLLNVKYDCGDLGDIGNEIGIVISKKITDDKMGYGLDDFIHGLKHGISLGNNTHP